LITESYVNLIPTSQGGTQVNGLRTGLLDALRDFCERRSLLQRGVKLTPDDIWDRCSYVLSSKLDDPQFSGQTKERLSSREAAAFVAGVAKDAFAGGSINTQLTPKLWQSCASATPRVVCAARKKWCASALVPGRLCSASILAKRCSTPWTKRKNRVYSIVSRPKR
jgi:topoisomerase-4 subunit B